MLLTQHTQGAVVGKQLAVLLAPGVGAAVEGVFVTLAACLVTVVKAGGAGQAVLQHRCHGQPLLSKSILLRGQLSACQLLPGAVEVVHQGGEDPGGIVGAQHIHIAKRHLSGIVFQNGHDRVFKTGAVVGPADKIHNGGAVGVVHYAVQFPVHKVPPPHIVGDFVGGILPHFAHEQGIGTDLPNPLFQKGNECIRQLVGNIQPEAVSAQGKPVGDDTILVFDDIADKRRVHFIHCRQGVKVPPAFVAVGIAVEAIPAVVGRFRGAVCAVAAECALFVKIQAVGAGVGVHPVQHHLDTPLMGGIAHGFEVLRRSQHGVRSLVVAGVVAVGGKAFADGIQIQNRGTQGGNVVHLFRDAPKVAAVEVVIEHFALLVGLPHHFLVPVFVDGVGCLLAGKIAAAGFVKPVRENLVDGAALRPFRGGKIFRNAAELPLVAGLHVGVGFAVLKQPECAGVTGDAEKVEVKTGSVNADISLPQIIVPLGAIIGKGILRFRSAVFFRQTQRGGGGLHRHGNGNGDFAFLPRRQTAKGVFVLQLFGVK